MEETTKSEVHTSQSCGVTGVVASDAMTPKLITLQVCPSTGGDFDLSVSAEENVDGLRKAIGRKLKVPKERINLLYKDSILKEGNLLGHNIVDGSKITLLPNVESGLVSQKAEHTVIQALENLSDSQVNEFLAGRSPLTLAMRLGDHMMFVQLQLSTNPNKKSIRQKSRRLSSRSIPAITSTNCSIEAGGTSDHIPCESTTATNNSSNISNNNNNEQLSQSLNTMASSTVDKSLLNTAALAKASRNLSQKLRELSQVSTQLSKSSELSNTPSTSASSSRSPGAIIESMEHHGHGVYSGTFSGTLNPALQDQEGKPKKDISTIVHILNDLLGAQPQYKAQSAVKSSSKKETRLSRTSRNKLSIFDKMRLSEENQATKGKMDQILANLQERRQKRKERQEAKTTEQQPWNKSRDRNGSDSSNPDANEMEVDANVEASMTENVHEDSTYSNLAHETILA